MEIRNMSDTYMTSEIAKVIGIHPNTVRLYEEYKLIPKPKRRKNGYRIFTDLHIEQLKLARHLLSIEVLQNGLRKMAIEIIKTSASGDFDTAIALTKKYLDKVNQEQLHAEEALADVRLILSGDQADQAEKVPGKHLLRREAAELLEVTIDTLRNWELNGLMTIKRKQNGYRVYSEKDIRRLKIIRSLRCANYSLAAILRMLNALSKDPTLDIKAVINTPRPDDNIISACDHLLSSLQNAEEKAKIALEQLGEMKKRFG
jgi:DNA-binding transcriptional MerR regulator